MAQASALFQEPDKRRATTSVALSSNPTESQPLSEASRIDTSYVQKSSLKLSSQIRIAYKIAAAKSSIRSAAIRVVSVVRHAAKDGLIEIISSASA